MKNCQKKSMRSDKENQDVVHQLQFHLKDFDESKVVLNQQIKGLKKSFN